MITYCPTCANMLLGKAIRVSLAPPARNRNLACFCTAVELTEYSKELRYFCQCCPYVYNIDKKVGLGWVIAAGGWVSEGPARRRRP